jgi:hypothetical protein
VGGAQNNIMLHLSILQQLIPSLISFQFRHQTDQDILLLLHFLANCQAQAEILENDQNIDRLEAQSI